VAPSGVAGADLAELVRRLRGSTTLTPWSSPTTPPSAPPAPPRSSCPGASPSGSCPSSRSSRASCSRCT
jgi:hypothetical protein